MTAMTEPKAKWACLYHPTMLSSADVSAGSPLIEGGQKQRTLFFHGTMPSFATSCPSLVEGSGHYLANMTFAFHHLQRIPRRLCCRMPGSGGLIATSSSVGEQCHLKWRRVHINFSGQMTMTATSTASISCGDAIRVMVPLRKTWRHQSKC